MWFLEEIWFVKIRFAICKKRKRKEIWFVKINSVSKKGKKEEEEIWLKKIKSVVCRVKKSDFEKRIHIHKTNLLCMHHILKGKTLT